jgi:hypothetical protein
MQLTEIRLTFITDEGPRRTGFILPPGAAELMNRDKSALASYLTEEIRIMVYTVIYGEVDDG